MRHFLVDRLVERERGQRFVAVKTFPMTEDYLHFGFPRPLGEVPFSIILESIVQVASLFLGWSHDFTIKAVPVLLVQARYGRPVRAGERVFYVQDVLARDALAARMRCRALTGGEQRLEAEFVMGYGSAQGNWTLPLVEGQRHYFRAIAGEATPADFVEEAWACERVPS
jgi:3-hydroxymyristoyl/3-hydroxydecanoyl-(acyl carrier protein) dehydratase